MSQPPDDPAPAPPSAEIEAEARRIVEAAIAAATPRPAHGRARDPDPSPSASRPPFERGVPRLRPRGPCQGRRRAAPAARGRGLRRRQAVQRDPRRSAARLYGAADGRWSIDIVIDELAMSHTLDLRDRLSTDGLDTRPGRPAADEAPDLGDEPKDLGDAVCLLADHPLARVGRLAAAPGPDGSPAPIDLTRIRVGPRVRLGLLPHGRAEPARDRRAGRRPTADLRRRRTRSADQVAEPPGRRSPRRRRRSAGRPAPASASESAGTRRPRRRAARSDRRRARARAETPPASSRPMRPGRRGPLASSCSNGGITSRMRSLLDAALGQRVEHAVGIDPARGVARRP